MGVVYPQESWESSYSKSSSNAPAVASDWECLKLLNEIDYLIFILA